MHFYLCASMKNGHVEEHFGSAACFDKLYARFGQRLVTGIGLLTTHMLDLIARLLICGLLRPVNGDLLVIPVLYVIHLVSTHY